MVGVSVPVAAMCRNSREIGQDSKREPRGDPRQKKTTPTVEAVTPAERLQTGLQNKSREKKGGKFRKLCKDQSQHKMLLEVTKLEQSGGREKTVVNRRRKSKCNLYKNFRKSSKKPKQERKFTKCSKKTHGREVRGWQEGGGKVLGSGAKRGGGVEANRNKKASK